MRRNAVARPVLAFALLAATTLAGWAADIDTQSRVASVTVFPQGAAVTRSVTFDAPAGPSVLIVSGVPGRIDPATLRVDGAADAALDILSVGAFYEEVDPLADEARVAINDAIKRLQDEFAALEDRIAALEAQRRFIENLTTEAPKGFAERLGQVGAATDQWDAAWRAVAAGILEVQTEVRQIRSEQGRVNEQIQEQNRLLSELPPLRDTLEVRIEIAATAAAAGTLSLSYRSDAASWAPAYDAELTVGDEDTTPSLHLIRRAEVSQATGEDWTDVALTLSTARPSVGMRTPALPEAIVREGGFGGGRSDVMAAAPRFVSPEVAQPVDAREQEAIIEFGDFRAEYIVPAATTVDSDSGSRSLRLASEDIAVAISIQATPRLSEQAFIHAEFVNPAGAPILPGSVSLFRDGAYVGADTLPLYIPGAPVSLGFGADDQVRIRWTVVSRNVSERGLIARERVDERLYRIDVENNHTRAVDIAVYDRRPVSVEDDVTVTGLPATTPPTKENFEDRRGVMAWSYSYEPGQAREIFNGYQVAYPVDRSVNWGD